MPDYIDRDAVYHAISVDVGLNAYEKAYCIDIVRKIPAEDVAPVRHGRWVDHCVRDWRCSECGDKIIKFRSVDGYCYDDKPNFCPNCGAKMDGGGCRETD